MDDISIKLAKSEGELAGLHAETARLEQEKDGLQFKRDDNAKSLE